MLSSKTIRHNVQASHFNAKSWQDKLSTVVFEGHIFHNVLARHFDIISKQDNLMECLTERSFQHMASSVSMCLHFAYFCNKIKI